MLGLLTLGFLPGKLRFLLLGVAVGLLTAPRSGQQTRALLQQRLARR